MVVSGSQSKMADSSSKFKMATCPGSTRSLLFTTLLLLTLTDVCLCTNFGTYIGSLEDTVPGVAGDLYAVDKTTIFISNMSFPTLGSGTFMYAGTLNPDGSYTKTGYPLTNLEGVGEELKGDKSTILLSFPQGKSIYAVDWIGMLDRKNQKMIGRVLVSDNVKLNIPRPRQLGPLQGKGEATASDVIILDSRSILLQDFTFSGEISDTYFMIGKGGKPSPFGTQVTEESGSLAPLGKYRQKSVILNLPPTIDVSEIDWFSIWSQSLQSSLAEIEIPRVLNVPPSRKLLANLPQEELNCEVLAPELGLQLRWTIVGESILLQIEGDIGSDMYMAFGVKTEDSDLNTGKTQGDVVVGWINTGTGKGGVDDYFLSGKDPCADGAESCPDTTKQGGMKNVELLNTISRKNYTMITFKRPLLSADPYDVSISSKGKQEVFWSVGYKKADLRMNNKPLKNQDPIYIEFGRPVTWNCPLEKQLHKLQPTVVKSGLTESYSDDFTHTYKGRGSSEKDENSIRRVDLNYDEDTDDYNYDYTYTAEDEYLNNKKQYQPFSSPYLPPTPPQRPPAAGVKNSLEGGEPRPALDNSRPTSMDMKEALQALQAQFPKRADGQKTTLELIPELNKFIKPFFPKGPPPGATPPPGAPPPGAAPTHPPTPLDSNWEVPSLGCKTSEDTVFYLQIGPAAGGRGNQGLGEHGHAWYINGELAPDLYLAKGIQYTFIVEGGMGTDDNGVIHPFYLTSDIEGGYGTKSDYEAQMEEVYGGVSFNSQGLPVPAIMGRLCIWRTMRSPQTYATYQDFKAQLKLECQDTGKSGVLRYEADYESPSIIYYQSFTEKFVGGKIHLLEYCSKDISKTSLSSDKEDNKTPRPQFTGPGSSYSSSTPRISVPLLQNTGTIFKRNPGTATVRAKVPRTSEKPTKNKKKKEKSKKKVCNGSFQNSMPQFEHFPVTDILKEGLDDDCNENFTNFDWNDDDDDDDDDDEYEDYDDYVQPTRKPLIFKPPPFKTSSLGIFSTSKPSVYSPTLRSGPKPEVYTDNLNSGPPAKPADFAFDRFDDNGESGFGSGFPNLFSNMPGFSGFGTSNPSPPSSPSPSPSAQPTLESGSGSRYENTPRRDGYRERDETYSRTTQPSIRTPDPPPYEFYTQRPVAKYPPIVEEVETNLPSLLPPPETFSQFSLANQDKYKKGLYEKKPESPQKNPFQALFNPIRDMFKRKRVEENIGTKSNSLRRFEVEQNSPIYSLTPAPLRTRINDGASHSYPSRPMNDGLMGYRNPAQSNLPSLNYPAPLPPPSNFPAFKKTTSKHSLHSIMGADRPNGGDLYRGGGSLYRSSGDMLSQGGGRPERRRKGNRRFNNGKRPGLKNKFDSNPFSQYNGNIYERDQLYSPSNIYSVEESLDAVENQANNKDPSGIGIGVFQDVGLVSESGFRPILPSDNNSPTLAFSIYDNPEKDALIDTAMDRMDSFQGLETEVGDRGNIVVNIPTSVLPYTPNLSDQDQLNDRFYPEDYAGDYDYDEMDGDYSEINPVYSLDGLVPNLRFSRDSSPEHAGTLTELILAGNSGENKIAENSAESTMQLTHFRSETADLPYIPKTGVQRSLMVDAPINSVYRVLDKTTDGKMDVSDIKEDDYENNSADFHSFETIYNPAAEIKVGNVQDVLVKTSDLESGKPVLLSVASSFSYSDNKTPQIAPHAVGSVSAPQYILETSGLDNGGNSSPNTGQNVVYGKGVDQPHGPLSLLEEVDERIKDKLDLLHQTSGDTNMADVVEDFWTGR